MSDGDYICVYRQFFENFAKSFELEDHRPMRVNVCTLSADELVGEIIQLCVNFLTERGCPKCLVVPLTKIVVEELLSEAKKQPEEVNTPLKLSRKTMDKISEVCLRYTDNEKLSSLPGPVQETLFSSHSTKHKRRRMEDRHICLPRFNTLHGIQSNSEAEYYGIFDGHAGVNAACFAVSHLHQFLAESKFYSNDPIKAFTEAYEKTESRFNAKDEDSGTTSLAILYQPTEKKLIVSWVGDSQALLVTEDSYVMLVDPHKPERPDEKKRIEDLGGCIIKAQNIYRVNGGLAISRAIGDKKLKPFVSAEPEFRLINLTGSEHFVVMGCDGLWDVVEPQQVMETVYMEIKKNEGQIDSVAKRLVDLAKENNSDDNISVIVLFLTDPSEINNRSVDGTGHRPKILNQNGVIMEPNFQPNEKLFLNDSGMNGIYETNGNLFEEQIKNESDEDLGPETDVDALDEVLNSPKNLNPFSNDCWQKGQMNVDNADRLIEFARKEKVEFVEDIKEFPEDFAETLKNPGDLETNQEINTNDVMNMKFVNNMDDKQLNEEIFVNEVMNTKFNNKAEDAPNCGETEDNDWRDEIKLNKISMDDRNPFDESVINNYSEELDYRTNGSDDAKYAREVDLEMNDVRNLNSNLKSDELELSKRLEEEISKAASEEIHFSHSIESDRTVETETNRIEELIEKIPEENNIKVGDVEMQSPETECVQNVSDLIPNELDNNGSVNGGEENVVSNATHENDCVREVVSESQNQMQVIENNDLESDPTSDAATDPNEKSEMIFAANEPETDVPKENAFSNVVESPKETSLPADASDVESAPNEFSSADADASKTQDESELERLEPSAPVAEGEIKDEIVAESGGEVEDSEDDEWNYFKVESEARVPVDNQPSDSVLLTDEIKAEKATMNSPLNPDAAEFIPVFPTATSEEYSPETPVKSVPHDLSDIVASSPNWMHMENVTVPEESTFLEDIKSRPTNVFEDVSTPQKENFNNLKTEESQVANAFPDAITTEETENLREAVVSSTEVGGISWANDMTSSFIDPYSIGFKKEVIEDAPKQQDNERHEKLDEDKEHFEQLQHQEHSAQSPHPEHQERRDHLGFDPVEVMEPIIEQKKVFLTNETPHLQEPDQLESESVSSIAEKEIVSPVSPTPVTSDFSGVEAPLSPVSEPSTAEVQPSDLLGTKAEEPVKTVLTPPSAPLANEELNSDFEQSSKTTEIPLKEEDKLNEVIAVAGATAAVAGVITSVGAVKQDTDRKPSPKTAPNKTTKTTTPKPLMNGTKTSAKKPLGSAQPVKSTVTTKTVSHNTSATSPTKTSVSRVSTVTKTTLKSASPVTSTLSKTQARTKPSTPPVVSKSPITKAVTSTTSAKSSTVGSKPPARVSGTTPATAATKSKPRVSSAPIEKKTTATLNGDARTVLKRTETTTTTKKPNSTTSSMTVTRVSLTSRPATAPAKSTTAKTTITTTKTMTAKPRTTLSSTTTTTSTVTTTTRVSTGSKKPILGADKQAKEAANRLTSKTGMMAKTNGIGPGKPAQTLTKVRKSLTTTSSTPSKTKTDSKTEIKAEKIINNSVEIIQSENEMPLIENNKDINLINSMASD